jgi:hypothetical protein
MFVPWTVGASRKGAQKLVATPETVKLMGVGRRDEERRQRARADLEVEGDDLQAVDLDPGGIDPGGERTELPIVPVGGLAIRGRRIDGPGTVEGDHVPRDRRERRKVGAARSRRIRFDQGEDWPVGRQGPGRHDGEARLRRRGRRERGESREPQTEGEHQGKTFLALHRFLRSGG